MRAVFDTNIFVSALVFLGGKAEAAVFMAAEGRANLIISKPIIHEVLDVLARKFERNQEELARIAIYLSELAEVVYPRNKLRVLHDEPDIRILECAIAGGADVIVTGDRAMLSLREYKKIRIISLKEFLQTV